MRIELLQFSFQGGDFSEYNIQSAEKREDSWKSRIDEMATTAFPTRPRDTSRIPAMAFANFPAKGSEGNVRIHCVYFQIIRARAFRNVFCFAYHTKDCSLAQLAGVSAEEWYRCCCHLREGSKAIECKESRAYSNIPEFESYRDKIVLYQFPNPQGRIYTKSLSNLEGWKQFIRPPQQPDNNTTVCRHKRPKPIDRYRDMIARLPRYFVFIVGIIVGILIGFFLGRQSGVKSPSSESTCDQRLEKKTQSSSPREPELSRRDPGGIDDKKDPHNSISQPHSSIGGTAGVSSAVNTGDKKEKHGGANTTNSENEQQAEE